MKERTTEKAVSEKISAEEVVLDEIIVEETAATEIDAFPCDMCGSKSLRALMIHYIYYDILCHVSLKYTS